MRISLATVGLIAGQMFAQSAWAADLPVKAPPAPPPPVLSWTGFYVGVNVGGAWDNNHGVNTLGTPLQDFTIPYAANSAAGVTSANSFGNSGRFIGGGQFGYNWQFGRGVAGFEADIDAFGGPHRTGILTTTVGPFPFAGAAEVINTLITTTRSLDYLGTIRGRLGFLATPSFLLYGTGGGAYGGERATTAVAQSNNDCVQFPGRCLTTNQASLGSTTTTRFGWTAGVGGEYMFAPNMSMKVEYLYYDLGSVSYNSTLTTTNGTFAVGGPAVVNVLSNTKFNGSIARFGFNYQFGGPVVAKF